ncbi:MAG: Fic family protein [Reyranellaceae bacterium]
MAKPARPADYDSIADPYCYPGTTVLANLPGIREPVALAEFEAVSTAQRADEPLPTGRLSLRHYRAIHRHLFQDVYAWAGKFRTVRLSRDGSVFCYPENIDRTIHRLFADLRAQRHLAGLTLESFATAAARFIAALNAIHPFREGNGRTQTIFLTFLADHAGQPVDLHRLVPARFLKAMIESFHGDERRLTDEIRQLIR